MDAWTSTKRRSAIGRGVGIVDSCVLKVAIRNGARRWRSRLLPAVNPTGLVQKLFVGGRPQSRQQSQLAERGIFLGPRLLLNKFRT